MAQEVTIKFILDKVRDSVTPALTGLKAASAQVSATLLAMQSGATRIFNSFSSILGTIFNLKSAMVAFVAVFTAKKFIEAAQQQEDAVNDLNSALEQTGRYSGKTSQALQNYASDLQNISRYGDETIIKTMGLIQTLGDLDEKGLKRATAATLDMASALKINLQTAALLVGKAAQGEITTFSKYGIMIKKGADNATTFANTLSALEGKFGGRAAKELDTFSGASGRLSNYLGDILENIGFWIIQSPELNAAIKLTTDILKDLVSATSDAAGAQRILGLAISTSIDLFGGFLAALDKAYSIFRALAGVINIVGDSFGVLVGVIGSTLSLLTFMDSAYEKFSKGALDSFRSIKDSWSSILAVFGAVEKKTPLTPVIESLAKFKNKYEDTVNAINKKKVTPKADTSELERAFKVSQKTINAIDYSAPFKKLQLELSKAGKTELQVVAEVTRERKKLVSDALAANQVSEKDASDIIVKINLDQSSKILNIKKKQATETDKLLEEQKRAVERAEKEMADAYSNPIKTFADSFKDFKLSDYFTIDTGSFSFALEKMGEGLTNLFKDKKIMAAAGGLLETALRGKAGAAKIISEVIGTVVDKIIPGLGKVLQPLLEMVGAMGAEAARRMVSEFITSMPDIIFNIIDSVPAIMEAIADSTPIIVERLLTQFTDPMFWHRISVAFMKALLANMVEMPIHVAEAVYKGVVNGFKNAFSALGDLWKKIFKFDGGGRGTVEKFLGIDFPFMAFAEGGKVRGNANVKGNSLINDVVPALLSPGEIVLPRTAVNGGIDEIFKYLGEIGAIPMLGWGGKIGKVFKDVYDGVKDTATGAVGGAIDIVNSLGKPVVDLIENAIYKNLVPKELKEIIAFLLKIGASVNVPKLIANPVKEVGNALKSALGYFKDSFMKLLGTPLALGGEIPNGYNENFPARLSSGELVIDRKTNSELKSFLASNSRESITMDVTNAILSKILNALNNPVEVNTSVNINERSLADVILQLSRTNQRLA